MRPIGICVDDWASSFGQIARVLQAAFPGQVLLTSGPSWPPCVEHWPVAINMQTRQTRGIHIGQDPLHVYKRLLESLSWRSRESAFAGRCLQSLLGSWNPAKRMQGMKDLHLGKKMPKNLHSWIHFTDWELTRAPTLKDVLNSYFNGFTSPRQAFLILSESVAVEWTHPQKGCSLPLCVKAIIMKDVGNAAKIGRQDILGAVKCLYGEIDLTADEIASELDSLAECFQNTLFQETRGGPPINWFLLHGH